MSLNTDIIGMARRRPIVRLNRTDYEMLQDCLALIGKNYNSTTQCYRTEILETFFYAMLLAVCGCGIYLWACLSRFDQSSFALFRMSVVLTFRHFPTTILLLALFILGILGVYLMPWGILIFPGCVYVLSTYPMERILLKYSPKVPEGDAEAQKWYYQ